ncbi:MAG TPA: hypothetical protein PK584_01920 [Fervidobacterium sp.]|jgi:hypothetical protein|nr:hypothetical protein [Fervidobacterium sp.]
MSNENTPTIHSGDKIEVAGQQFEVKALNFSHKDPVLIIEAHLVDYVEDDR